MTANDELQAVVAYFKALSGKKFSNELLPCEETFQYMQQKSK